MKFLNMFQQGHGLYFLWSNFQTHNMKQSHMEVHTTLLCRTVLKEVTLGKRSKVSIGETNTDETYGVGTRIDEATSIQNLRHRRETLLEIP